MSIEKQERKEQSLTDISSDRNKLSCVDEKTANSRVWWVRDRITTNINPYNRGASDYSSEKNFESAFNKARNTKEEQFIRKGERYNTKLKNLPGKRIRERDDFKGSWLLSSERPGDEKHGDLFNYYKGKPLTANTHHLEISKYAPTDAKNKNARYVVIKNPEFQEAIIKYFNENYKDSVLRPSYSKNPLDKKDYKSYKPFQDLGNFKISKGEDNRWEFIQYYDTWNYARNDNPDLNETEFLGLAKPFEIYDRIYIKDYWDGTKKRMYYSDNELNSLDIDKKNFDTLALQKELSNRWHKLPNSTKKDGNLDGVFGEETKEALLDRKERNK